MCLTIELKFRQEADNEILLMRLLPSEGHKGKSTIAKS